MGDDAELRALAHAVVARSESTAELERMLDRRQRPVTAPPLWQSVLFRAGLFRLSPDYQEWIEWERRTPHARRDRVLSLTGIALVGGPAALYLAGSNLRPLVALLLVGALLAQSQASYRWCNPDEGVAVRVAANTLRLAIFGLVLIAAAGVAAFRS